MLESDNCIPEKIRTRFLWGNGWERGRGEMRPEEAVSAQRCLRQASTDDEEEQRERGHAVDCLSWLWRSALKARIEDRGAAVLAPMAEGDLQETPCRPTAW